MIYLDYNATAPVYPEVILRMQEILAMPANPSSAHRYGREAKKHLENARKTVASVISAWPDEVIFTGSATEANAMALLGTERHVLTSSTEHSSVLNYADEKIFVKSSGVIDMQALETMLAEDKPTMVSVMLANNETGVIQPIAEVAKLCKHHGALLHCDAVQGLGKILVDFGALGVDMMTLAAHKCGGPVGAAALVVRRGLEIKPLLLGGGQELRRRAGTENVAAIAGFAKAAEMVDFEHMRHLSKWLHEMEIQMKYCHAAMKVKIFSEGNLRLPNTVCVSMPGVSNEVQLMNFDMDGFAVSAGSACSSGRIEPSHVLLAMWADKELAASAIRISAGWQTTQEDIIRFTEAWKKMAMRLGMKTAAG